MSNFVILGYPRIQDHINGVFPVLSILKIDNRFCMRIVHTFYVLPYLTAANISLPNL